MHLLLINVVPYKNCFKIIIQAIRKTNLIRFRSDVCETWQYFFQTFVVRKIFDETRKLPRKIVIIIKTIFQ